MSSYDTDPEQDWRNYEEELSDEYDRMVDFYEEVRA